MSSKTAKSRTKCSLTGLRYVYKETVVVWLTMLLKGLLIIGHIFKTTAPDESDEDRRELERYAWTTAALDKPDFYTHDQYRRRCRCWQVKTSATACPSKGTERLQTNTTPGPCGQDRRGRGTSILMRYDTGFLLHFTLDIFWSH